MKLVTVARTQETVDGRQYRQVQRVTTAAAEAMVEESWHYVPKSVWRRAVRKRRLS